MGITNFKNRLINEIKTYSQVLNTYTTFVFLGTDYTYSHLLVASTMDEPVLLRFGGNHTLTVGAFGDPSASMGLDGFEHDGNVEWKYPGDAPTTGNLYVVSF